MDIDYRSFREDSDWQSVQSLLAQVPMSSGFPLASQRTSTYSRSFPKLEGTANDYIAHNGKTVLGYLHSTVSERRISQQKIQMAYLGDGRMHPDFRRHGIASKTLQATLADLRGRNIELGYFLVLDNNETIFRFFERQGFPMRKVTSYVATSLFVFARPHHKSSGAFEEFTPKTDDFTDLISEWSQQQFAPTISVDELEDFFWAYPEIRVFRERTSQKWAFALWNQESFRRLAFTKNNRLLRTVRPFWNLLAAFGLASRFPAVGQTWSSLEVVFTTRRMFHPELKSFLVQEGRRQNMHTVNLIESGLSQESLPSKHWAEYKMKLGYYLFTPQKEFPTWLSDKLNPPYYLDLGFV